MAAFADARQLAPLWEVMRMLEKTDAVSLLFVVLQNETSY